GSPTAVDRSAELLQQRRSPTPAMCPRDLLKQLVKRLKTTALPVTCSGRERKFQLTLHCCPAMKPHKSAVDPIDVDADNVLADINIVDLSAAPSMKTIRKDANRDLSEFFEEPVALTGKDGKVWKCRSCKICG
ncbi:hypothetical protein JB92DRAFT_3031867, partial [Gautieria morchelliformis]